MGREESVSWISSGHEHLLLFRRLHDEDAVVFAVFYRNKTVPRLCFSFQSTLFLGSSVAVEENKRQAQVNMIKLDNTVPCFRASQLLSDFEIKIRLVL